MAKKFNIHDWQDKFLISEGKKIGKNSYKTRTAINTAPGKTEDKEVMIDNIDDLNNITIRWKGANHHGHKTLTKLKFEKENEFDEDLMAISNDSKWLFIVDLDEETGEPDWDTLMVDSRELENVADDGTSTYSVPPEDMMEHTVTFTKDDMASLHNDGELVKADDDGKEHTYIYKEDLEEAKNCGCGKNPCKTYGNVKEQGFDDRLANAMGMSDDEFEDQVASRDIGDGGSSFPGDDSGYSPAAAKARDYIETFKKEYREMSDDQLDEFSVEIIDHLLNNTAAQARAKVFFAKKGI